MRTAQLLREVTPALVHAVEACIEHRRVETRDASTPSARLSRRPSRLRLIGTMEDKEQNDKVIIGQGVLVARHDHPTDAASRSIVLKGHRPNCDKSRPQPVVLQAIGANAAGPRTEMVIFELPPTKSPCPTASAVVIDFRRADRSKPGPSAVVADIKVPNTAGPRAESVVRDLR